jgi:hypothetical protein
VGLLVASILAVAILIVKLVHRRWRR